MDKFLRSQIFDRFLIIILMVEAGEKHALKCRLLKTKLNGGSKFELQIKCKLFGNCDQHILKNYKTETADPFLAENATILKA